MANSEDNVNPPRSTRGTAQSGIFASWNHLDCGCVRSSACARGHAVLPATTLARLLQLV